MSLSERSAVPFARLPDSSIFFSVKSGCSSQIAFQPLAQAARLRAVFVGLLLRQIHLLLRELDDVAVVNVLSCHASFSFTESN